MELSFLRKNLISLIDPFWGDRPGQMADGGCVARFAVHHSQAVHGEQLQPGGRGLLPLEGYRQAAGRWKATDRLPLFLGGAKPPQEKGGAPGAGEARPLPKTT